jgi:hypothetical protein
MAFCADAAPTTPTGGFLIDSIFPDLKILVLRVIAYNLVLAATVKLLRI